MKKNLLIISVCVLMFFISSPAQSAEGLYAGGSLGLAMANDSDFTDPTLPGFTITTEFEPGWGLSGAVGYDFNNFRVEGEIAYQKNDVDEVSALGFSVDASGDMTALAFLINGYFDFVTNSPVTPYISAGIGFAKIEINDFNISGSGLPSESDDDTVFAYQIGAGIGFAVNPKVTIDLKYRYFATEDPEFDEFGVETEASSHIIYVGARFYF